MSRTFHRRAPKNPTGSPPPVAAPLREVTKLLIELELLPVLDQKTEAHEGKLQEAIKKTFGSVQKGYGSIIALRNALRSVKQAIGG